MDWEVILGAVDGRATDLDTVLRWKGDDAIALATLLLLEEAPHPAATLAVAATTVLRGDATPILAALAPLGAPALAAWRDDSLWHERAIGDAVTKRWFARGVAGMVGALHDSPAALHDAVAIVVRDGDSFAISRCLDALGADGWKALEDDRRAALLARAAPADLGRVWAALDEAQRKAAVQEATTSFIAADLIGSVGAVAWEATDRALRDCLIDAVARDPSEISSIAPAWAGMTDDERARLIAAATAHATAWNALDLLTSLGAAGRATLTADQRAALERCAMEHPDAWLILALRAAAAGWTALTADERAAVLAAADQDAASVAALLRTVGAAGWRAMTADEQTRIVGAMRRMPDDLFRCPPALWDALAGAALPPATAMAWHAPLDWRAEDADADLSRLPPSHQALVLALAPWRTEDATKGSARVRRLLAAWGQTSADERVALATAHPSVLATVAAAARLRGGASDSVDAVGETLIQVVSLSIDMHDTKRAAGRLIRVAARWRDWMETVAPTDGDPPEVWDAWRDAARRGIVLDLSLCARLVPRHFQERPRLSASRRAKP